MELNTDVSEMSNGEKAALVGGVLAVVGAFMPWATALGVSVSGTEGDGVITLVLGIVVVGAVLAQSGGTVARAGVGLLGVLVALIALVVFGNMEGMVSPAIGLYITLLAGLVIVAGAGMGFASADEGDAEGGQADEEPEAEPVN